MASVRTLLLCGGPDIAVDGVALRLRPPGRRHATVALGYLLLGSTRPVPADELAEALWPSGPPSSWSGSLRRILSDLRSWMASGGIDVEIRATHGAYQLLLPPDATTDVLAAKRDLELARGARALDRADDEADAAGRAATALAAPLLPGHEAPWLQTRRQELARELLEALDLLSDAERRRGRSDAALDAAERAIAIDPLRESSHRLIMVAHRQAGRIGAALRAYEHCRRILADEVGTAPSPATTTVYHALLALPVEQEAASSPLPPAADTEDAIAAAARRMRQLETRRTIAALKAKLATIDADPDPDPRQRVETLIGLGRAHWVVEGSTEALRRISLAAGEAALALGLPDAFADALSLASTTTGIGQVDPDAEALCERGRTVFADHPRVQVHILGLSAELEFGERSIELAQRAVDAARALDDERLLLDMLLVLDQSLAWTPDTKRRLAVHAECNDLLKRVPRSWRRRPTFEVMTRLQVADVEWLDHMGARYPQARSRPGSWELRVYLTGLRAVEAKITGDLGRARRLATELFEGSTGELNAVHAAGGLLLAIARETGDVSDLLPSIEGMVESNPRISAFCGALAAGRAITGDRAGALRLIDAQAEAGFDAVAHDHVYLLYLGLMAEAVAVLDLTEHAPLLLDLLAPYEGQLCVGAHGLVVLNAMDTYRGMLATVTGDPRGPAWLAAGAEVEGRVRAVLLQARTMAWQGAWLRRHGRPSDRALAARALAEARARATAAPDRLGLLDMVDRLTA